MSYDFDGVDDIWKLQSPALLDNLSSMTCSVWMFPDGFGEANFGRVFDKGQKSFFVDNDGTAPDQTLAFNVACSSGAVSRRAQANFIVTNKWNHAAVTWTGGTSSTSIVFYVNGIKSSSYGQETTGVGAITSDASSTIDVGNRSGLDRTFNGRMAHLQIWARVLSEGEIKQTMFNPGSVTKDLIIYLPMVIGVNSGQDLSGNKLNAGIQGATPSNQDPPINNQFLVQQPILTSTF